MPIETIIFFVSWLALAVLGAGLLLYGWKWLLVSRMGMAVSKGRLSCFLACAGNLCRRSVDRRVVVVALAIFGGGLYIHGWKKYVEPRSDMPKVL